MMEQFARAKEIVVGKKDELKRIAEALIEYETLEGEEVQGLLEGRALTREPPKVRMPTREEVDRRYKDQKDKKKSGVLGPLVHDPSASKA
jgi:cell division protease FtsH